MATAQARPTIRRRCDYCGEHALYAMDENGTSVHVAGAGAGAVDIIGHAIDDSYWPCPLVPQPNPTAQKWADEIAASSSGIRSQYRTPSNVGRVDSDGVARDPQGDSNPRSE